MSVVKAFNKHFIELLEDIKLHDKGSGMKNAINGCKLLIKTRPKFIPLFWKIYAMRFGDDINKRGIESFIDMDYKNDEILKEYKVLCDQLGPMRDIVKEMNEEEKGKILEYIKNLNTISLLIV